jgi:oligopeptide/dipeptide ABC transporter ATP-binding protein
MGLLPASAEISGSARLRGSEMIGLSDAQLRKHRGSDMAMVFQDPARSLNPTMRIGRQITEAIRTHRAVSKSEAHAQAVELLRLVRIPAADRRFHEYPHQLSGGMRQRVMIAIALACRPRLLIADEATTALDVTTQAQIMELLLELQQELGMALILISHDLGLAASYADEVVVMYAGKIVEQAPARQLFGRGGTVKMRYTRALLDAIPHLERAAHTELPVVSGRPPDPTALPPGCSFAPRCPSAADDCTAKAPALTEHVPGHRWACWHPCENGVSA